MNDITELMCLNYAASLQSGIPLQADCNRDTENLYHTIEDSALQRQGLCIFFLLQAVG